MNGYPDRIKPAVDTVVIVEYQVASGVQGGTFTAGSYQTRPLNTIVLDTRGIATLVSNQITLPAGTFEYHGWGAINACNYQQARLFRLTDSTPFYSMSSFSAGGDFTVIDGRFTNSGPSVFEFQHRCSATRATDGLGAGGGFGNTEIYSHIEFRKVS